MCVYVLCALCIIPSTEEYGYVPITDISEDLSSVSLLASSDLISAQIKYSEDIRMLYKAGASPVILPIKSNEFQKLASYVHGKASVAINAFKDIMHQYADIFSLFGVEKVDQDLASALYSAIIAEHAPAFITKDMEIIEGAQLDIKDCLVNGLDKFQEISEQMQDPQKSQRILGALMLTSGSDKISELMIMNDDECSDLFDDFYPDEPDDNEDMDNE